MEAVVRLDTHVVVWLYAGTPERLSKSAIEAINNNDLVVSPIVELELTHLFEIGRLTVNGPTILGDLGQRIGLSLSDSSMVAVMQAAGGLSWTRDPFDRIIVGDAIAANTRLITKHEKIRDNFAAALW
jgi:PIN domain nuclease of toxin-antitoxin system